MNELIATIHFIGLCLFTTVASTDAKLHVVLPRIQSTGIDFTATASANVLGRSQMHQQSGRFGAAVQPRFTPALAGVENHTAFLAFKDSDLVHVMGWTPQPLPHQPGYKYIVLDGEAISFYTSAQNAATAGIPPGLPSAKCCNAQTIRTAFKAADRSGNAAVFRIPNGTVKTCTAQPAGGNDGSKRIDTKVALANTGAVVVLGETKQQTARSLILKGNATLYVANLPSQWVANATYQHQHNSPSHYRVYPAMFEHPQGTNACPIKDPVDPPSLPPACGSSAFRFGDSPPPQQQQQQQQQQMKLAAAGAQGTVAINSDCSNSSWP